MIVSLAISLLTIASGAVLTYTYDEDEPLASRLCSGACIGFSAMGLAALGLALLFGLNAITLALTAAITALPLLLLTNEPYRARVNENINAAIRSVSRATSRPNLCIESYASSNTMD